MRWWRRWLPDDADQLIKVDRLITVLVEKGDDKSRGEQFVASERKISECAEFRSQMQSKYSAASPRALDYIVMMRGEHSLLEFLRNLELDVNFSRKVDQETEFVTCTWWPPKDPKNAQP